MEMIPFLQEIDDLLRKASNMLAFELGATKWNPIEPTYSKSKEVFPERRAVFPPFK